MRRLGFAGHELPTSLDQAQVLMDPTPPIVSKHTFVGLIPNGIRRGDFITNDPEMLTHATRTRRAVQAGAHR